jgi:uncharacterized protein (DUF58 family)
MGRILPFLVVLLAVAFFTGADFFFYLLYVLFGTYVLSRWWARRALEAVALERRHDDRVFSGETFSVEIRLENRSLLPVLWMRLSDRVPSALSVGTSFRQVISLNPHERQSRTYQLSGRRRGYYRLGPMVGLGGDLLGTNQYEVRQEEDDFVIVYPRIVALSDLGFPSLSPFGTLPSRMRLFEDPSRIRGVRDYQPGDSPRRMDWKTSARVGRLQVRRFEPAIALETAIFLNMDGGAYPYDCRVEAPELGVVIAASAAVHLVGKRQAVGLACNGRDPLAGTPGSVPHLPLRKGREHLTHLLDLLARVELASGPQGGAAREAGRDGSAGDGAALPFLELLNRRSLGLPWGSTVLVVTPTEEEGLVDSLLLLRRRGLAVILVLTCAYRHFNALARRAGQIGVQALQITSEREMDVWR